LLIGGKVKQKTQGVKWLFGATVGTSYDKTKTSLFIEKKAGFILMTFF
jgi:hypothetical protein